MKTTNTNTTNEFACIVLFILIATLASSKTAISSDLKSQNQSILLQANEIIYQETTNVITASGNVELSRGGRVILADEISPDTCRLWDSLTDKKLDKDRFRKDLGNIIEAYQEIAKRFGIIHEQSNIRPLKFSKPKEVKFKKNK